MDDLEELIHFDLNEKTEVKCAYPAAILSNGPVTVGITAGASCPNNLIEDAILRIFQIRGIDSQTVRNS